MCHKNGKTKLKTPIVTFVVVLVVFLSAECAAGILTPQRSKAVHLKLWATRRLQPRQGRYEIKKSRGACLNYGHACWGAHGKRNGRQEALPRIENETPQNRAREWFLSKMINPLDLRYYRDMDASRNQPEVDDLFTDPDGENSKSDVEWDKVREILKNPVSSIANGRTIDNYLEKRSTSE